MTTNNTKKKITDYDINELIDCANGGGFSPEQMAGISVLLQQYRGLIDKTMESLKESLREIALERKSPDDSSHVIHAEWADFQDGHVVVSFMNPSVKLKKSTPVDSISGLEQLLTTKVTYSPNKDVGDLLTRPEYAHLKQYFVPVTHKPRVGFRDFPYKD